MEITLMSLSANELLTISLSAQLDNSIINYHNKTSPTIVTILTDPNTHCEVQKNPTYRSIQLHVLSAFLAYCIGFTVKGERDTGFLRTSENDCSLSPRSLLTAKAQGGIQSAHQANSSLRTYPVKFQMIMRLPIVVSQIKHGFG